MRNSPPVGPPSFNEFDVRLDPWAVEYGGETPAEFEPEVDEDAVVDVAVECDAAAWAPLAPASAAHPRELAVVDGVRRIEARLVVTKGERLLHGALGACAVGAVHCRGDAAAFGDELRARLVIFGRGEMPPAPLAVSPDLHYRPRCVPEDDPDAPLRGLQREMRAAEELLARRLAMDPDVLVLADGPLSIGDTTPGRVVGFVKRLFKLYLGAGQMAVLRRLPPGTRTPVFLIRGAGRFSRYSWFTRIAGRLAVESDLTGLVRLEVADRVGVEEAIRLADMTTSLIPRFVPPRSRDPRAPQNLVPIGALEAHLRRGLGDTRLIRRRVATLLAGGVSSDARKGRQATGYGLRA